MVNWPEALSDLPFHDDLITAPRLVGTVDPCSYADRLATYRLLIEAANRRGVFGPTNAANPLWGLVFQLAWQHRTGRLHRDGPATDRIDPDAPWAYGNFTLCLLPLLGAMDAGLVDELTFLPPSAGSVFDYVSGDRRGGLEVPPGFREPIEDWAAYFALVAAAEPGDDLEPLVFRLWAAHKSSLDLVRDSISAAEHDAYSATEIRFLSGWCRMVDYLWAASWPTDFDFMFENGRDVLPERLLTDTDEHDGFPAIPDAIVGNIRNVLGVGATSPRRFRLNLALWRRAMRTRAARDQVVEMLDALFNPTPTNRSDRRRLFRYMIGL